MGVELIQLCSCAVAQLARLSDNWRVEHSEQQQQQQLMRDTGRLTGWLALS